MTSTTMSESSDHLYDHDRDYAVFRQAIQTSFSSTSGPLFETDIEDVNTLYLDALPFDRAVHICTACRRFLNQVGGLVRVASDGSLIPVMWCHETVPDFYKPALISLSTKIRNAQITRPFLSKDRVLGTPKTGVWEHFAVQNCPVFHHAVLTPGQAAAAKMEDFRTVSTALALFKIPILDEALRILKSDHLHMSERFIAPLEWLRNLADRPRGRLGDNLLWQAVATAPDGYCHPRSSVVGTLLDDLQGGFSFDVIKKRWDAKTAPLAYQRPQAAPTSGAIEAAEALFATMGLGPSLERRFARLDECQTLWLPRAKAACDKDQQSGLFSHLKTDRTVTPVLNLPHVTMTWEKFTRTVLPNATEMRLLVPNMGRFIALVTAVHADAPMILKWAHPVSWYVYPGGSPAATWGLEAGWRTITGVCPLPTLWGDQPQPYLGEGAVLILDGAVDQRDAGNALFPALLRSELHGVRSVIEAYSQKATLSGRETASACGYDLRKGSASCTLRAYDGHAWNTYAIDRWD